MNDFDFSKYMSQMGNMGGMGGMGAGKLCLTVLYNCGSQVLRMLVSSMILKMRATVKCLNWKKQTSPKTDNLFFLTDAFHKFSSF